MSFGHALRTFREEMAAYGSQLKAKGVSPEQRALGEKMVGRNAAASVRANYAHLGGVRKAALGGKLGKALRLLRLVR